MPSHPMDEFIDALDAYRKGQPDAAVKLAKSLGGNEATEPIKSALPKIFERGTPLHEGVLGVIISEARRRERR